MRSLIVLALLACAGCRAPYMHEIADMTVREYQIPPYGTPAGELNAWFDANGFAPGARILQSESELRRPPGAPLVYALEADRTWWLSRMQTVRDFCVTQKIVYYKLDTEKKLSHAILTSRSQC